MSITVQHQKEALGQAYVRAVMPKQDSTSESPNMTTGMMAQ